MTGAERTVLEVRRTKLLEQLHDAGSPIPSPIRHEIYEIDIALGRLTRHPPVPVVQVGSRAIRRRHGWTPASKLLCVCGGRLSVQPGERYYAVVNPTSGFVEARLSICCWATLVGCAVKACTCEPVPVASDV